MLLALATAASVGVWLAALNVRYRDVRYVVPFVVQFWLFATPVAYPASLVPARWRAVYGLNPMAGVVEGFRWALAGRTGPGRRSPLVSAAVVVVLICRRRDLLPPAGRHVRGRDLMSRRRHSRRATSASATRSAIAQRSRTARDALAGAASRLVGRCGRRADGRARRRTRCWALRRRLVRRRAGRGRRHHRPQRRRQEHAAEDPRRGSPSRPTGCVELSRAGRLACSRSAPAFTPSSPAARTST